MKIDHCDILHNLRYHAKCHSRSHRIPRSLDHNHVSSSVLFRAVLRLDCVSRPGYANSKARYGIKSRCQICVYSTWCAKHIHMHIQCANNRCLRKRERERSARTKKRIYRFARFSFDTDKIPGIRRTWSAIVSLRNQLCIATTCVLLPSREKRFGY